MSEVKTYFILQLEVLTLFRVGLFGTAHEWGRHTYPTMMKLGTVIPSLKKSKKIYKSRDTVLEFCGNQHFFTKNQQCGKGFKTKSQKVLGAKSFVC